MIKNFTPTALLKRLLLSFLLLIPLVLLSQNNSDPVGCGTTIGPEEYLLDEFFGNNQDLVNLLIRNNVDIDEDYLDQLENMSEMPNVKPEMFGPTSTVYNVPIKAWIYRNDNGSDNISKSQAYQIIDDLNTIYSANTNINFYLLCDISLVNNSNYANYGDQYFSTYTANNRTIGAINVHFVINSAPPPNGVWQGLANFPWGNVPYSCAVARNGIAFNEIAPVLAHEIGHNLGLRHTHDTARSNEGYNESAGNCYQEAVDRGKRQGVFCVSTINQRKCEINGDGLCDTEADPGLYREGRTPELYISSSCIYNSSVGGQDNWNDDWTPTVSNIMGYAYPLCLTSFSPLQVGIMYGNISGIGINEPAFNISGPTALCNNQIATYTVNTLPGVTSYFWEVPNNMTILASGISTTNGQGTPSITVKANNSNGGEIKVTPNCGSKSAVLNILNLNQIAINGYDQACPNYTYTYTAPVFAGAGYSWSAINGSIVGNPNNSQVQLQLGQNSPTTLNLQITNVCNYTIYASKTILHGDPPFPAPQCITVGGKGTPIAQQMQKMPITEYGEMLIYPNPATSEVTIVPPTNGFFILSIYNTIGQSMYQESIEIKDKQIINVNTFPDGIYYVKLEGELGITTKKLILKK